MTAHGEFEDDDPFRYSNLRSGEADTSTATHRFEDVIYQRLELYRPKRVTGLAIS
jgi:hypothetical protein